MKYSASLACASQLYLGRDIKLLLAGDVNIFHIDLMDGHNVLNLCMNFDQMKEIKSEFPEAILDVHMMMSEPEKYLEKTVLAGADIVVANHKTLKDVSGFLQRTKELGAKCGLVLNPDDSLEDIERYLNSVDHLLLMSVVPGAYGQKFREETYERIEAFDKFRHEKGCSFSISVDGGVDEVNGREARFRGTDMLVLGVFAVFKQEEGIAEACMRFKNKIEK